MSLERAEHGGGRTRGGGVSVGVPERDQPAKDPGSLDVEIWRLKIAQIFVISGWIT